MGTFRYTATGSEGGQVSGEVEAEDLASAADAIRRLGLVATRLESAVAVPSSAAPPGVLDLSRAVAVMPAQADAMLNIGADGTVGRLEPWERGGRVEPPPAPVSATIGSSQPGAAAPSRMDFGTVATWKVDDSRKSIADRFADRLIKPLFAGAALKDLAAFYRQFATLIGAGLPLFQALVSLEGNTTNPRLKRLAADAYMHVQRGGKLSDAFAARPWLFNAMQIATLQAAEQGGMLDEALRRMAGYVEHELEVKRLIAAETLYPKLVLFVALMLLGGNFFVTGMPAIADLVLGRMTPAGYFMDTIGFALMLLIPVVLVVALFRLVVFNSRSAREAYDQIKVTVPVTGGIVRSFVAARFVRTLAALYRGGFALGTAVRVAGDSCGNAVACAAAYRAGLTAEQGGLISDALARSGFFPKLTIDMMRTGEVTGNLDATMDKVAEYYEAEGRSATHKVATIFAIIVFLLVALLVLLALMRFYGGLAARDTGAVGG
ncbi:MAG: type II secretion system F family protein [Armatimonadetes bacterium]|nr:type II secretion system F family protein [Armatimonadota bacterium]MDE2207874.1 type II secretion system F family protein [Armatimonadota bacterium]